MAEQWVATCKDCGVTFKYSDASLQADVARGYAPPERCKNCRRRHRNEMRTVGMTHHTVRRRMSGPPEKGRLGRVHHDLPPHRRESLPSSFARYRFGITHLNILQVYACLGAHFDLTPTIQRLLEGSEQRTLTFTNKQVLVIEGPTGSGKSTLLPYRLLVPPDEVNDPQFFTRRGKIIVTQPRIQPTSDIPRFIADKLHGSSYGPGVDIGYQYSGEEGQQTDGRNRLVFVTDGTLINWIIQEQLNDFSVIMIDEAHERNLNIDLILGLLKARLPRYPHLKLIIASATINAKDFITYFGGPEKVAHLQFQGIMHPVQMHFAPDPGFDYDQLLRKRGRDLDQAAASAVVEKTLEVLERVVRIGPEGDILVFLHSEDSIDYACTKLREAISKSSDLYPTEVFRLYRRVPKIERDHALRNKAEVIANKIVRAASEQQHSLILAQVLDRRTAEGVIELIQNRIQRNELPLPLQQATVQIADTGESASFQEFTTVPVGQRYVLVATYEAVTSYRQRTGTQFPPSRTVMIADRRVIISTNVAETSLTVDGVAYVVDSGLIKQKTWDPQTLSERLVVQKHSRSGCRQRRGRAGRVRPGHAYSLYSEKQFEGFVEHTPPEIQRMPLEAAVLTAKAAGVSDITTFDWFQPTDELLREMRRSQQVLIEQRILDPEADITEQGLELRSMALEPHLANLLKNADRYACALEVATIIPLLARQKPLRNQLFVWDNNWDAATRWEVRRRQQGLIGGCNDDLDLIMKIMAAWESRNVELREEWAHNYFVNHDLLANIVRPGRDELLAKLAIATRGEVIRGINLDLLDRVRLVLAYSLPDCISSSAGLEIAAESICFAQDVESLIYGIRIPYRTASNIQGYRVSFVVRLRPHWEQVKGMSPLEFGRFINRETRRKEDGVLQRSLLWQQLLLLNVPIGAVYAYTRLTDGSLRLDRQEQPPPPVVLEEFGRLATVSTESDDETLEVAGDEHFETEALQASATRKVQRQRLSQATIKSVTWSELGQDLGDGSSSNDVNIDTLPDTRMRLICHNAAEEWRCIDMYVDGVLDLEAVSLSNEITPYLEIAAVDGQVLCVPAGVPPVDPCAVCLNLDLTKYSDYTLIIGPLIRRDGRPTHVLMPESRGSPTPTAATLRWVSLGKMPRIDVYINGIAERKGPRFYFNERGGTVSFEVYRQGAKQRGDQPLLRERKILTAGNYYTVVLASSHGDQNVMATWIDESTSRPATLELPTALIPDWIERQLVDDSLRGLITSYDFSDTQRARVHVLPIKGALPFARFTQKYNVGQTIHVMPVIEDHMEEHHRHALIVRDRKTYLEMAVDGRDLSFPTLELSI